VSLGSSVPSPSSKTTTPASAPTTTAHRSPTISPTTSPTTGRSSRPTPSSSPTPAYPASTGNTSSSGALIYRQKSKRSSTLAKSQASTPAAPSISKTTHAQTASTPLTSTAPMVISTSALAEMTANGSPPTPASRATANMPQAQAGVSGSPFQETLPSSPRPTTQPSPSPPTNRQANRSRRSSASQIPRNIHHNNPLSPLQKQQQLQQLHTLIMQRVLPPVSHH